MPKRPSSLPRDPNARAFEIVRLATSEERAKTITLNALVPETDKNPAAVALGKLGGSKGGKARAKALSARRRKEIAKRAAKARWSAKR
jgi:hypothetical protein